MGIRQCPLADLGVTISSRRLAFEARRSALRMVHHAGASHIGSSLSLIDILAVLYAGVARVDAGNPSDPGRDIVVVSKGHASAGTYAVLGHAGFFPLEWLDEFCGNGQPLQGHVTAGRIPGVEFSTGSLGHGLAVGVGIALAAQRSGRDRRVFVVMSDGECDEGSVWEAALFAAHHGLGNVTAVIDRNGLQSFGTTEATLKLEPLGEKWRAFGWAVREVDGHEHEALHEALKAHTAAPQLVVASTIKGKGVSFMENGVSWHYRSPNVDQLTRALRELEEPHA